MAKKATTNSVPAAVVPAAVVPPTPAPVPTGPPRVTAADIAAAVAAYPAGRVVTADGTSATTLLGSRSGGSAASAVAYAVQSFPDKAWTMQDICSLYTQLAERGVCYADRTGMQVPLVDPAHRVNGTCKTTQLPGSVVNHIREHIATTRPDKCCRTSTGLVAHMDVTPNGYTLGSAFKKHLASQNIPLSTGFSGILPLTPVAPVVAAAVSATAGLGKAAKKAAAAQKAAK